LNNWRNGFGTKAAKALKRYIEVDQADYFENCQIIADWVKFLLTPDGNPPTYPFQTLTYMSGRPEAGNQ
jgi:hypothetical protein